MSRRSVSGFTLVEVMVALAILAVMTVFTAGAIQSAIRAREKIGGVITRESTVRDALRVIERDVNAAFHYRDISPETAAAPAAAPANSTGTAAAAPPPAPTPDPNRPAAVQLTQFVGEKDRLNFTALSHVRTQQDAAESDQEEVGYYTASCRTRSLKPVEVNCLWRRHALEIDNDVTKGGEAAVLVENVESFKLRYLGPKKEEWQEAWKTDVNGDDLTRDTFPYAVEVALKVLDKSDPNAKPVSMTMVAEIRFPNNAVPPPKPDPVTSGTH